MALGKRLINTGGVAVCNTESVQAFGADSAFSSNIALYQLDGNDDDTTTNYNGTSDTGVSYSATGAKFGQAASFNGSSSAIVLPNNILNTNEHSISLWFNLDDTNGIQTVLEMDYENRILFRAVSTDSNLAYIGSVGYFNHGISFSAGQWYHLVITFSAGNPFKIYVDGVLSYTGANSNINAQSNDNILGAANSSGANGVDGKIDQVRIFDKAISAEDVATLYAETSSTASNTNPLSEGAGVALYTMDYDASEASGYYDGTPSNVDFGVGGQINYGARFNGSSSKIDLPNILPANSNADSSFTCWFKTSDTSGNQQTIVNAWNGSTTANNGGYALFKDAGNVLRLGNYYLNSTASGVDGSTNVGDGNWHFVAIVFDYSAGTLKLFLDGNSTPEATISSLTPGTVNPFNGGAELGYQKQGGPFRYWNGDIDQVRIFSKELSQSEMDTLYNSGNGETACVHTATANTADFPSGATAVAHYPLDNSSEDNKGTNDGTDTNIEYRFGRYGQAAVFNGSSSIITATQPSGLNGPCTYSAWLKTTSSSYQSIITVGSVTGSHTAGVNLFVNSGKLSCQTGNGSSTENSTVNSTSDIDTGNWVHCAVVVAGSTQGSSIKVYVNGQEEGSGTADNTAIVAASSESLCLGGRILSGSQSTFLNGSLDQVRIYSSALTSSQVTELYEEKPEVDTSNFKAVLYEGNGDTSNDTYISNVGIDLETNGGLVWVKARTNYNHLLMDSVRGTDSLTSNDTTTESDNNNRFKSYEANGFMIRANNAADLYKINRTGNAYVSWVWKGGGEAVQNNNGTILSNVSSNVDSGFSIATYTGVGYPNASTAEVGHGLSQTPDIVFIKGTGGTGQSGGAGYWVVGTGVLASNNWAGSMYLNSNTAYYTAANYFWNGAATNSVVKLKNDWFVNGINNTYVMYSWHSVAGYSSIGSYSGDNSTDRLITTGFDVSFVMIKKTNGSSNWQTFDIRRGGNKQLDFNSSAVEFTASSARIEFVSNGFRIKTNYTTYNATGGEYIYMAFK